jgi:hypothetical protein
MPSLLESFGPLSSAHTGSASLLPVTTSPQQQGATSQGYIIISQDGNKAGLQAANLSLINLVPLLFGLSFNIQSDILDDS